MAEIFLPLSFDDLDPYNLKVASPDAIRDISFLSKRILWLEGEISDYTLEFVKQIVQWNIEDIDIPKESRKPIRIFFNSPGGLLDMCFSLIDTIETSITPVIGINVGECCSAAAIVFISCHKTMMFKHSYFLYHTGSGGLQGTHQQVEAQMLDYKEKVLKLKDFVFNRLKNIERNDFDKNFDKEWYIYKEEALKLGICDQVVSNLAEIF